MFGGTDEGYVQYNVTPAFGTQLKRGDTISISGSYVYKYDKSYAVGVGFGISAYAYSFEAARIVKTVSKGSSSSFTFSLTVNDDLLNIGSEQEFSAYIRFAVYTDQNFSYASLTVNEDNGQAFRVLKYVNPPVLSNVVIRDETGGYEHFGALVQNKSKLIVEFDYSLDTSKVSDISVSSVSASIGQNALTLFSLEAASGHAKAVFAPVQSIAVNAVLSISLTDSMNGTGSTDYANTLSVYTYSSPYASTIGSVDLARRYDYKPSDYGDPELVLLPEGKYLMLNFNTSVTSIAGKNAWTIKTEFADADTAEPSWTTASTTAYADGQTLSFVDNVDLIGEAHTFSSGLKYLIRVTVTDFFESTSLIGSVDKATGYFQITKYGISMGRQSSATSIEPKTESEYPLYPYAGIRLIDGAASKQSLAIADGASFTYYNADADIVLTSYGNLVSLSGVIKPTKSISGSNTLYPICKIPEEYAPTGNALNILQQGTDRAIWLLTVSPKDDPNTPCQVSFSRYRTGSSSAQVTTSTWLTFYALWIAAPKELVVQTPTAIAGMALDG